MPEAPGHLSSSTGPVPTPQPLRAPLAAAPGAPPQAQLPAAQRESQLGKDGGEKTGSGGNSNGTDNSVGSGAENEDSADNSVRGGSASGDKRDNGADSLDSIEHEKQLAWKKEKRRKQNREAQRRRRETGKDEFGNLNMAMRYAGDLGAGGQLQSNVSMLQKQLSFGGGGMHPWANYNAAMQGNMLGQGLSAYGQVQIFSLYDNIL